MFGRVHNYNGNRISPFQVLMMVILLQRPMYGYEVLKAMREHFEGIYDPQTGAVYPALRRLQEHGLLTVENVDGKDNYSLSQEGRAWLNEELSSITTGMLFMARTMELMGTATIERRQRETFVPLEEQSPEDRLQILRKVRSTMERNMKMLDEEIAELERDAKE